MNNDRFFSLFIDICHQVLDLYSQQPSRTDSPQGPNSTPVAPPKVAPAPALPAATATPTKPGGVVVRPPGGGFDQRLDAMQPKVEVSAAAGYVNYAMGVTNNVAVPPPLNMNIAPPLPVQHVPPPHPHPPHAFPPSTFPPHPPYPPMPPAPPQAYPPLPPAHPPHYYPPYGFPPGQVYPPVPPSAPQPPPPPRPY